MRDKSRRILEIDEVIYTNGDVRLNPLFSFEEDAGSECIGQLDNLDESRNQQMLLNYSEIISRFTLLLGAGINMKGAWIRIVGNYSNKRKDEKLSVHYI